MSVDAALGRIEDALPSARDLRLNHGQIDFVCDPHDLVQTMQTVRDDPELACKFFTFMSGVDRSAFKDNPGGLEVLIHVYSPERVIHVNVHVPVDTAEPVCPTISHIYSGALWHERETREMFGVDFPGHPRLVNLYLPEDFDGHPLLKSFKLPGRVLKEWPGAKDPEEAAAGGR